MGQHTSRNGMESASFVFVSHCLHVFRSMFNGLDKWLSNPRNAQPNSTPVFLRIKKSKKKYST